MKPHVSQIFKELTIDGEDKNYLIILIREISGSIEGDHLQQDTESLLQMVLCISHN